MSLQYRPAKEGHGRGGRCPKSFSGETYGVRKGSHDGCMGHRCALEEGKFHPASRTAGCRIRGTEMKSRDGYRYIIKVFEAQWDQLHEETVKPFFEQLKRDTEDTYARRNGYRRTRPGADAPVRFGVFQHAPGRPDAPS